MPNRPISSSPSASARLKRQKQRDTKPELIVRKAVYSLGHRYRLRNKDLPGSPDLANRSRQWAVFVHGCFWHHHAGCQRASVPKSNREWWLSKFRGNKARDRRAVKELRELGYAVVIIWECETTNEKTLEQAIETLGKP